MPVRNSKEFEERAIFLAAVCGQTYTQFLNADGSFLVPSPYTIRHTIQAKSIGQVWERFGFILESPEELIIAFRGTSSTSDWISDALASQKKFKYIQEDCLTHRGFTDLYSSARSGILSALARSSPEKTLYVTGHSLGGALATLCAVDLAANTSFSSPLLYTFGSPRVGDPAFAKAFATYVRSSYRIANPFDVVTHSPPFICKLPKRDTRYYYRHIQTLFPLSFQNGAIAPNHLIGSYFEALSKLNPAFAEWLCSTNPGFCPDVAANPQKSEKLS